MDRLDAMKTLVRVVELGSLSAAARERGVSQAHVSRTMKRLESELGCSLLARTTRKLALTSEGNRFLQNARSVIEAYERAEASVREAEVPTGCLRVSAPVGYGQRVVAPVVDQLTEAHSHLEVELHLTDRFVDLVAERYDVAVRLGELPSSSLRGRRIGVADRAIIASPKYLEQAGRPKHPTGLQRHELLVYTRLRRPRWALHGPKGRVYVSVTGCRSTDHLPTLRDWVLSGRGIAQLPVWLIGEDLADGALERVLPRWGTPSLPVWTVFPPTLHRPFRVRAFVAALADSPWTSDRLSGSR